MKISPVIRNFIFLLVFIGFLSCRGIINPNIGCVPGPNNTHAFLTYTSYINSGASEIFRVELDNTLNTQISHLAQGNTGFSSQSLVADVVDLYFLSDSGGKVEKTLYSINQNGSGLKKILPYSYLIYSANYIPGIPEIVLLYNDCPACARPTGINSQFGVFNTLFSTFTKLGTAYSHADLSKDGKTIYFDFKGTDLISHIYSIKADGTGLTQLTNTPLGEEYPALSPDGNALAIASWMDSGHNEQEICLMSPDGTSLHQITKLTSTTIAHQPCWSPARDQIFFSSYDQAFPSIPSHIFSTKPDGTNIQKFTSGNGEAYPSAGYMNSF